MWAEEQETPEELLLQKEAHERVTRLLDERRAYVLVARYHGWTLEEIGRSIERGHAAVQRELRCAQCDLSRSARTKQAKPALPRHALLPGVLR